MGWRLWLDDQLDDPSCPARHVPEGFMGARSSREAVKLVLDHGMPEYMDLDHDLGDNDSAMVFLNWIAWADLPNSSVPGYNVHSANPVGRENIISFMRSWKKSLDS